MGESLLRGLLRRRACGSAYVANDSLAASFHMHVLDCDLLLALAAMLIERIHLAGIDAKQFRRMFEILFPCFERLARKHSSA